MAKLKSGTTIGGSIAWHASNDGSGSGLDADLLDGQHGSYYYSPANAPDPILTINGDASGSATFTNLGNATLTLTIADDSHNHTIANVDGLQVALDAKLAASSYTAADVLAKIKTVDGATSGLDADLLDGNHASAFLLTTGKAADSNLLDGLDSSAFLRSNASDTASGVITFSNTTASTSKTTGAVIIAGGLGVSGDVWATNFKGTASAAKYSDLAERYETDGANEAGTIMVFGGEKEITSSTKFAQTKVAGVISTEPAVMMNSDAGSDETHPYIALQGRVPCKVVGKVRKGDIIVTSNYPGVGQSWANEDADPRMTAYVGIAIEDKNTEGEGLIEVKVGK